MVSFCPIFSAYDDNKAYLHKRMEEENNPKVKALLKKDMEFLDHIQM